LGPRRVTSSDDWGVPKGSSVVAGLQGTLRPGCENCARRRSVSRPTNETATPFEWQKREVYQVSVSHHYADLRN